MGEEIMRLVSQGGLLNKEFEKNRFSKLEIFSHTTAKKQ